MFDVREKPSKVERALLIGIYFEKNEKDHAASLLTELVELVTTLEIEVAEHVLVRVPEINRRYLAGSGKAKELWEHARAIGADILIFDNMLMPSQQRAWEEEGNIVVIDREEVILDIFAMRARTREARLQVELALMQYSLPRLKRMWTHLDRQGGGGSAGSGAAARGEGETQLEVDRRLARLRIDHVRAELADVRTQRQTQRKERVRSAIAHAAIVGYTNSGKSTLLNRLTNDHVLEADMLFATLDPTTRRLEMPNGQMLLLTDTVGFIRNLPTRLIEAFKATLEESLEADFLIHVVDAANPEAVEQYQTTQKILAELEADSKRQLIVFNKIDLVTEPERIAELQRDFPEALFVSLRTGEGVENLVFRMNEVVQDRVRRISLRIPQSRYDIVNLLHSEGKITAQTYEDNDILIQAIVPKKIEHVLLPFQQEEGNGPNK